jgi:hypothetical protein
MEFFIGLMIFFIIVWLVSKHIAKKLKTERLNNPLVYPPDKKTESYAYLSALDDYIKSRAKTKGHNIQKEIEELIKETENPN